MPGIHKKSRPVKEKDEDWETKIQQLETENDDLKIMLRDAGQDFKSLITSLKKN